MRLSALKPSITGCERFEVLTEQTGGAVSGALAGGERSISNNKRATVTGSGRVSRGVLPPSLWGKRMGAFIDKAIIVLKALIVFLELIRMFF